MTFNKSLLNKKLVLLVATLTIVAVGVAFSAEPLPSNPLTAVNPATGPTLKLDYAPTEGPGNSLAEFMYFVPLISPEPVSLVVSRANTQKAQVTSCTRRTNGKNFTVTCRFEFAGQGYQRNVFDHSEMIRRHETELKAGGSLGEQLSSISVEGSGSGSIEVEGNTASGAAAVTEVRMKFNSTGRPSPVSISLQDIAYHQGSIRARKEVVARVNTLTFKKQPGQPKMGVGIASVKRKDAGNGLWQNFKGSVLAGAANLLMKPVAVHPAGQKAMLDFGLALATNERAFTFPAARNLRSASNSENLAAATL